jgi:similar to stage IV sporulation protein
MLNLAARDNINLWGVRRQGTTLKGCCLAKDYRHLRVPVRKSGMRMHVAERHGAPFIARRYRARAGLALGLAIYVAVLQVFSQRIWVVEVRGNQTVSTEEILTAMEEFGVQEGADLSNLDINSLQMASLKTLPDLAWCVVNLSGSVAYVDVTERIPTPELSNSDSPSNIKATADGRIVSVEVYTGQAMVKAGDAVAKGMLLVSGVVDSKVGPMLRRSQASILAETTRTLEVCVPLTETLSLPTGQVISRPYIHLFTLDIPLFTSGQIEKEYTVTAGRHLLPVNGISLPVGLISQCYEIMEPVVVERSEGEAAQLAAEQLADAVSHDLADAEITAQVENGGIQDGCYVMTGVYTCIEEIGTEVLIEIVE